MAKLEITLQNILNRSVDHKSIFGTSFCIKYRGFSWCGASGNIDKDEQYFIASTTKLFTTAVILKLRSEKIILLEDKIEKYLSADIVKGLNVVNGNDYSSIITVKNLMSHTSGIADYFEQKDSLGKSLKDRVISGKDKGWTFKEIIELSKALKPQFVPSAAKKAYYSDTNFQLLGRIIETVTGKSIAENYDYYIFKPLGLEKTYLYQDIKDNKPKDLYYKNNILHIPEAMASFGPDGGIVSTSSEMLRFIESFFKGVLFPVSFIEELKAFNRIFFPLEYGVGIMRFKLPWFLNPFAKIPELLGHSGLSGALAFSCPDQDLYIAGTVNQIAYPGMSFKTMVKIIQYLLKNFE